MYRKACKIKKKQRNIWLLSAILTACLSAPTYSQATDNNPTKSLDLINTVHSQYVNTEEEYKASLRKLLTLYEVEAEKAKKRLSELESLYKKGLITRRMLEEQQKTVDENQNRIEDIKRQIIESELQMMTSSLNIEEKKKELQQNSLSSVRSPFRTKVSIRYSGLSSWSISDVWKVQRFFQEKFGRPLPISAFGQSSLHDRWGLDHHNSLDVPIHPDSVEGQALIHFLRSNGIPFLAFRSALPKAATGPHIHIGYPSRSLYRRH